MSGTSGRGEGPGVRHPYRRHLPGGVARGLEENHKVAQRGGRIAGNARRELEQETGRPVATAENAQKLVTGVMEGAAALTERTDDAEGEKG